MVVCRVFFRDRSKKAFVLRKILFRDKSFCASAVPPELTAFSPPSFAALPCGLPVTWERPSVHTRKPFQPALSGPFRKRSDTAFPSPAALCKGKHPAYSSVSSVYCAYYTPAPQDCQALISQDCGIPGGPEASVFTKKRRPAPGIGPFSGQTRVLSGNPGFVRWFRPKEEVLPG